MTALPLRPAAPDNLVLETPTLRVEIARCGGELWRLAYRGHDRLWHGDPAWWNYRAPILFPVVGRSPDEHVAINGVSYKMPLHGFARDLPFAVLTASPTHLELEQRATAATRRAYPFAYRLAMVFDADGDTLTQATTVINDGDTDMPFCFGYHPGFSWPLEPATPRDGHVCRFDQPEPDPIRRADMASGLVLPHPEASPVDGTTMAVRDDLFTAGSLQFPAPRSRSVWFGRPGAPGLRVGFPDSPQLGIWTKPGAPYLCIEPWQGLAAEQGASAELAARPGARILAPGQSATYRLLLSFGVPA